MKKFLAIVFLIVAVSFCFAEGNNNIITLGNGMYVVGENLEAGSYTLSYDKNDPVAINSDNVKKNPDMYPAFYLHIYKDMDAYLSFTDPRVTPRQTVFANHEYNDHVVLQDGMVIMVRLSELEKGYLIRD